MIILMTMRRRSMGGRRENIRRKGGKRILVIVGLKMSRGWIGGWCLMMIVVTVCEEIDTWE